MGFDAAVQELESPKSKAAGLVLAADVSAKTEKEIRFAAEKHGKRVVRAGFTMDETETALGKRVAVLLILDEGLYGSLIKGAAEEGNQA